MLPRLHIEWKESSSDDDDGEWGSSKTIISPLSSPGLWTCGSVSCLPFGVMIWVESEVSVSGKSGPGQGVSKPIPTESRTDTQHIVRMLLLPTREPLSELFCNSLPPPPSSSA
nr:hypothetical protein Itr_chr10CG10630 [Ipomoea trifida]